MFQKKSLRQIAINRRKSLSLADNEKYSELIATELLNSCYYRNSSSVFCFVGLSDEIQTLPLIEAMLPEIGRAHV